MMYPAKSGTALAPLGCRVSIALRNDPAPRHDLPRSDDPPTPSDTRERGYETVCLAAELDAGRERVRILPRCREAVEDFPPTPNATAWNYSQCARRR